MWTVVISVTGINKTIHHVDEATWSLCDQFGQAQIFVINEEVSDVLIKNWTAIMLLLRSSLYFSIFDILEIYFLKLSILTVVCIWFLDAFSFVYVWNSKGTADFQNVLSSFEQQFVLIQ